MPRFSVHGRASRRIAPERATVHLTVSADGADRADVIARAASVHADVVAQARGHVADGAATRWTAGTVHAWTFTEWVKPSPNLGEQSVVRFRAGADVSVRFADFESLAAWVSEVAALDGVSVDGIAWELTDATRDAALRDVRSAAALDAVARAADYAAALGFGEPRLASLYEDGLHPTTGSMGGGSPRMFAMRADAAAAGGAQLELRPEDLEVEAIVTADFESG